jgi:GT2 family glycosyltransferase
MALRALVVRTEEKPDQVVVVNGGDVRSDDVVARYSGIPGVAVKLVKTVNKNLAASRNVGLPHCAGEIVGMTDDDAEVFPDWVTQMKRLHAEHPEAGGIGGAIIGAASADNFISRLSDMVTFPTPKAAAYVRTLAGVNVSYKREALDKVGPQDEALFRSEDVDFNWRISLLGYRIYYHPDVKVIHHHRPTLQKFMNQHYMYGRGYYMVRHKWPEMYCVYPHHFRRVKDYLKAVNFVAATFYEPLRYALKMPRLADKLRAYPVLWANQALWRGGMMVQKWRSRTESSA